MNIKNIFFLMFIIISYNLDSQCLTADSLYSSNVNHNNALANWSTVQNIDHYKIRYREIGAVSWSNLGNIDSTMTTRLIPMLQPLTTYHWEIQSYCNPTNQNGSGWSYADTFTTTSIIQCLNTDSLYTSLVTYENAIANWEPSPNPYHYKIHYRETGATNWSNLSNIDSNITSRLIPMLQPQTTYEWEIQSFCDSTNQNGSGWSYTDTFTTTAFIPSQFQPSIIPIISNVNCNMNTSFSIIAQQQQNEPDISSSIFRSDKGYFEINSLNNGDTLGEAYYSSTFINFNSVLILDFKLGPNYAKVDLIDSIGDLMGFFIIENLTNGIKVTSIGPNDGNNYTNGYISQLNFTDIFVNPNEAGPITFTAEINSELGDYILEIDSSIIINCATNNLEDINKKGEIIKIIDILGRETTITENKILFFIYQDKSVVKKIILKN